jgi:protease I
MRSGEIVLLIPVAGFPGGALLTLRDRLVQHAVPFVVAASRHGRCRGTGGVTISATHVYREVRPAELGGLIVLDGGGGGLSRSPAVLELVRAVDRARILVAGIGHGARVLISAGVLRGCAVAADDDSADQLRAYGAAPLIAPLVICDHVATTTESGAAALGDAIHDLRGPTAFTREPLA